MEPYLSISIVLYKNNIAQLRTLVDCISTTNIAHKIYFVDNSPTDIIRHQLKNIIKNTEAQYIFTGKNMGYGAAHNIALRKVINNNKYHLVINADITFEKGVLEKIYHHMEMNEDIGQLIPKVLYANGRLQYVCKLIPTPFNLIARLLPNPLFKNYKEIFELRFSGYNEIMNVPYLHGCFMFLRCSALCEIGLFDERFFMYPEDIDLTRRMHRNYKTIFYPYVEIFHKHTRSSYRNLRMFMIHIFNMIRYFNKWGWLFDKERTEVNRTVLMQLKKQVSKQK